MKIIIVGIGKVGRILTEQLSADKHDVIVIDCNADLVDKTVNNYDVMGIAGNGASYDVQNEANVSSADLLIATTPSDEINILACLVAKKLGVKHTIARIRNPEYEVQLQVMREELGLSMAINPEKATAREISRILRFPSAIKLETFSNQRIELVEYKIGKDNPLRGVKLSELYKNIHVKVLICAVARGRQIYIPTGDFVLEESDKIYLTASPQDLKLLFQHLGIFRSRASKVMIVGASKMAYYLACELISMGMKVKIIDSDEKRCREMSEKLSKALVICGDGTDSELLKEENIEQMDAFVALTGVDETNIILSLFASGYTSCKVVAKINRKSFADLVVNDGLVDSVVSTGNVTSEIILQYTRTMQNNTTSSVKTLHRIVNEKVEALEFGVTKDLNFIGVAFKDLELKDNILIAAIARRDGEIIIPGGNDYLLEGDDVIIITTNTSLNDLNDILK